MKLNICNIIFKQLINQKDKIITYLSFSLLKIDKFIYDNKEICFREKKSFWYFSNLKKNRKISYMIRAAYFELEAVSKLWVKYVQRSAIQTYKSVKANIIKKNEIL